MSSIVRITSGSYRNESIKGEVFTLVKGYQLGSKGGFVTVKNEGLFRAKMTLPAAAKHCGMTQKEMKLTFFEYLKYNKPDYEN